MDTDSGAGSTAATESPVASLPARNHTIDHSGRMISFSRVRDDYGDGFEYDEGDYANYGGLGVATGGYAEFDEDRFEHDDFGSPSLPPGDYYQQVVSTPTVPSGGSSRFRCRLSPDDASSNNNGDDDERLASLEALRYALHHAPFCRDSHTLMSVPDECSLALQGIPTKCAIRLEGVCLADGRLDHVNMEVPKGKIYALLGCAGSGKSALLQCIAGRLRPTAGTVTTFGSVNGTGHRPLSAICVGYMPQEVALHPELTVGQTLHHYGRLYHLPPYLIAERVKSLSTMLHLPGQCQQIRALNPGQKWRISLAVALIHSPPLLLLDEPTVMVDPLIRWSVWKRLERLCEEEGLTVLITTKYPEEIGFAYRMGLIRNGHIYAEDRPEELRHRYGCATYDELYCRFCESSVPRRVRTSVFAPYFAVDVEDAVVNSGKRGSDNCRTEQSSEQKNAQPEVTSTTQPSLYPILDRLRLHHQQQENQQQQHHHNNNNNNHPHYHEPPKSERFRLPDSVSRGGGRGLSEFDDSRWSTPPKISRWPLPMADWPICERRRSEYLSRFIYLDRKRLLALVIKNLYVIRGNLLPITIFYFLFPVLQIILMCAVLGRSVRHLSVTVPADLALRDNFGPTFVHSFLDQQVFTPVYTPTVDAAIEQIRHGRAWAAIVPWTSRSPLPPPSPQSQQPQSSSHKHNQLPGVMRSNNGTITSASESSSQSVSGGVSCGSPQPYGIRLYLDQSNYVIAQTMFYSFIQSMRHFLLSDTSGAIIGSIQRGSACGGGESATGSHTTTDGERKWVDWNQTAIDVHEVVYGSTQFRFLEFLLPGFLCSLVFMYSLVLAAYLFIKEHMAGLQARALITGTSGVELLASHLISGIGLYTVQQTVILVIVFRLFGLPSRGPFYSLWTLILLQGVSGISFGLFLAVICPKPTGAALLTSAIFIPAFFFSGIMWPIESMPRIAQHLSHALPLTLPINSLRYIISRGPDMHYGQIVAGFSISAAYVTVLLLLTFAVFKCKTSL